MLLLVGAQPSLTRLLQEHTAGLTTHTLCFLQCLFVHNYVPSHLFSLLPGEENPQCLRVYSAANAGMAGAPLSSVQWGPTSAPFLGELKAQQQSEMPSQPQPAQTAARASSECVWVCLFPHHVSQMYSQGRRNPSFWHEIHFTHWQNKLEILSLKIKK